MFLAPVSPAIRVPAGVLKRAINSSARPQRLASGLFFSG